MSFFCPVAKVGHWFLNFSKARILCSVPEGFGYAFFMLSSITNVCSSFQLIDQQIMLRFFLFQSTSLFSNLFVVLEMCSLVWNDYGKDLSKKLI